MTGAIEEVMRAERAWHMVRVLQRFKKIIIIAMLG